MKGGSLAPQSPSEWRLHGGSIESPAAQRTCQQNGEERNYHGATLGLEPRVMVRLRLRLRLRLRVGVRVRVRVRVRIGHDRGSRGGACTRGKRGTQLGLHRTRELLGPEPLP